MNCKIYLRLSCKAMADREKKVGAMETQKFEYLENEKSYLDEIKIMFHNYSRAISW